jgi:hypothetical protein
MGGLGSGRQGGRATVEGCQPLVLDINHIMRPVMRDLRGRELPADAEVRVEQRQRRRRRAEAETCAGVEVSLTLYQGHGFATLRFDLRRWSKRIGPQRQRVELVSTPAGSAAGAGGGSAVAPAGAAPSSTCQAAAPCS